MRVTEDNSDDELAEILIGRSRETMRWMRSQKRALHPDVRPPVLQGRRQAPLLRRGEHRGGRRRLWASSTSSSRPRSASASRSATTRAWCACIQDRRGAVTGVTVKGPDGFEDVHARAVVLACGGFEANPEMRVRYLGPGWELCRVRGTRHNTGDGIRAALDIGAQPFGGWSTCHAVPGTSARRPSAIASSSTISRSTPTRSASSSTCRASASSTRAPTIATTPTPSTAARS